MNHEHVYGVTPQPTEDPRVWTLPDAPNPPESLVLFRNGSFMIPGVQYTLEGNRITYRQAPQDGDHQRAYYERRA